MKEAGQRETFVDISLGAEMTVAIDFASVPSYDSTEISTVINF